jgi:hypothetical protein
MMTKDEFAAIEVGDVVLYNGRPRVAWGAAGVSGECDECGHEHPGGTLSH